MMAPFEKVYSAQMLGSITMLLLGLQCAVQALVPRQLQTRSLQNIISATCDWRQIGDALIGEGKGFEMGRSVAFSKDGSTIAVGSPGSQSLPGHVRIFDVRENNGNVALGKPIEGQFSGDEAGWAVGT